MEFRNLRAEELEHWLDHCNEVFGEDREYFARHYHNDPQTHLDDIFVAMDGGIIAATVRVFRRKVYIAGQAIGMGGIGEVSTKTDYRRQGLSGRLLTMAIEHMNALDMPISMLFTGSFGHYARYGWFQKFGEAVTVSFPSETLPDGYGLRPAALSDLPMIRAIYDLYAPRFNGAVVRDDPAYWERWIWAEGRKYDLAALTKDGDIRAYLAVTKPWEQDGKSLFGVKEFAAAPDAEDLFPAFLCAAAREKGLPGTARMAGPLWTHGGDIVRTPVGHMMIRLNKPFFLDGLVDTDDKLADALNNPLIFEMDDF